MSYPVVDAAWLSPNVKRLVVFAPHVTRNAKPGQFVIVRPNPAAERIPLTIAASDPQRGTVTLIIQQIGATTRMLCALDAGQDLSDIAGPLGKPTELHNVGHAVLVGGGVGTAVIYPQAAALRDIGNRVTAIIGGRTKELVILEQELSEICHAVYPCTDDGSHGFKGLVTDRLKQLAEEADVKIGLVLCAGPVPMMRAVADLTKSLGIPCVASLNPIMVDGTGMCGGCRVSQAGQMKFACVDGPEFDAHTIDFKELWDRLGAYRPQEAAALERHRCKIGLGK
jgi:ferredoxin--NADP+ reductase